MKDSTVIYPDCCASNDVDSVTPHFRATVIENGLEVVVIVVRVEAHRNGFGITGVKDITTQTIVTSSAERRWRNVKVPNGFIASIVEPYTDAISMRGLHPHDGARTEGERDCR
jgi:hypothetical protein